MMALLEIYKGLCEQWLLTVVTVLICYVVVQAVYNIFFNPLAHYPGPFFSKISAIPSFYYAMTGYRHIWIWQCHQIYGDTFRFQPNGILVSSSSAYRTIYTTKANVRKGKFYEMISRRTGVFNTLATVDHTAHARRRRVLQEIFSDKSIKSAETFIIRHADRWCHLLVNNTNTEWTAPRNMTAWAEALVFDIMGDLSFGVSFDIKEEAQNPFRKIPETMASYTKFVYFLAQLPIVDFVAWLKPRGLNVVLAHIAPKGVRNFYKFADSGILKRTQQEEALKKSNQEPERKDMFYYLYHAKDPETSQPAYSPDELNAEANLFIIAGATTTSTTLTALFFYIAHNPRVYAKLTAEIRGTFTDVDQIRGGKLLSSCQYIRACIDETLRMTHPLPSEMIRQVEKGGLNISGNYLPEGVVVGCSNWSLMQHPEYFDNPRVYRPERWIADEKTETTPQDVTLAKSAFFPFSSGPANCVGQRLATLELMIVAAKTLFQLDIKTPPEDSTGAGSPELRWGMRNVKQFQIKDYFVAMSNGPMLQFKKREDKV